MKVFLPCLAIALILTVLLTMWLDDKRIADELGIIGTTLTIFLLSAVVTMICLLGVMWVLALS